MCRLVLLERHTSFEPSFLCLTLERFEGMEHVGIMLDFG
jgi:hypothetical protein